MRFMPFALPRIPAASRDERAAPAPAGRIVPESGG